MSRLATGLVVLGITILLLGERAVAAEDAYLAYVKAAPEFQRVAQDPKMLLGRWTTWIYMPWRYQWAIGTGDEGGQFSKDYGFNGGFTDHGDAGPLPWFEKWHLQFYNDHSAGKGYLYLNRKDWKGDQNNPRALRNGAGGARPLDAAMLRTLMDILTRNVNRLKGSPMRAAYALDDEISWGTFVKPLPWRVNDDDKAYEDWLNAYYGGTAPAAQYVTPAFTLAQLGRPLKGLDFSPLLDRITYNDAVWANFLGKLVECANAADPDTPCGFVGGQSPNLWGGYDYAKLAKKIQFIEAYNIGSATAILRSFNPQNAMPIVTTHFHDDKRGTANDIWQTWYYFAHGNRGMIGWVENWFDKEKKPRPWLEEYKNVNKEIGGVQGPKMVGSRWIHDGVAIYYSHPSIQVSWCLDAEPHGRTWTNRNGDDRLGTSHLVRRAWEHLLTDSGIQYNFIPYDEVVVHGVPKEYKVLVLPACYALSDIEAKRITQFCEDGGTVVADFACGLFDQHGKGRAQGALDDLFGVKHDGSEAKADFFGGSLWVETNQDAGFSYKKFREFFATVSCKLEGGFAVAETRVGTQTAKKVGKGTAVYLNLSPQRYLQYREEGSADASQRDVFIKPVLAGGAQPWVKVSGPDGKRPANCEVTCWSKGGRTLLFVLQNAAITGSATGGGGAEGLISQKTRITVEFPAPVKDLVDERTGRKLGDGKSFPFDFNAVEAVFLSFEGHPPR